MNSVCFQSIVGHYLVHFDDIQSGDFSTSPVSCYRFYYDGYQYWLWCLGIVRCCSCCIFSFPWWLCSAGPWDSVCWCSIIQRIQMTVCIQIINEDDSRIILISQSISLIINEYDWGGIYHVTANWLAQEMTVFPFSNDIQNPEFLSFVSWHLFFIGKTVFFNELLFPFSDELFIRFITITPRFKAFPTPWLWI